MQLSGSMDTNHMLVEFVHKWGLDGRSQQLLEGLPAEVQEVVFKGFDPPVGTRSADAKLNAFVKRVSADMGHSSGGGGGYRAEASPEGGYYVDGGDVVAQFILQWGLDEVSEQLLRGQSPDYIREVTQSFSPPADTRNMSARFCTFLRGGSGFRQPGSASGNGAPLQAPLRLSGADEAAIQDFIGQWGLDDNCRQILLNLSYEAVQGVIADFNPPADTQNINARFMTFVRSRDKGGSGASGPAPLLTPWSSLGVGRRQADPLRSFVNKWGLDAQSEGMLKQLQPAQLLAVINDFAPPADTRNVSGRLTAFVKSVLKSPPGGWSQDPAEAFAQTWGIDADAYQALCALPAGVREVVMSEFNPPPGTLNASGKLKAFIRNHRGAQEATGDSGYGELSGGGGKGGGKGGGNGQNHSWPTFSTGNVKAFVEKWHLDESAEQTLLGLPEDVLADVMREFNPPPGTWNPSGRLNAFVRARMPDSQADSNSYGGAAGGASDDPTIRAFVDHWGLDGKSEEMLRGLSQDLLSTVISGFEPDATTRNRNAKLASWIRFLQTSQSGGDSKRARY